MDREIKLPLSVGSRYDLGRIIRELEALNDSLTQEKLRHSKDKFEATLSKGLAAIVSDNDIDLNHKELRDSLIESLRSVKEHAPVVHISFATEPTPSVTEKITLWFRREIDPGILLSIGVQPSIAVGCVIRTRNKQFDFSLRQHLLQSRQILVDKLREAR